MGLRPLFKALLFCGVIGFPSSALAQTIDEQPISLGAEVFVSTDSDDTTIVRAAIDFDLRNDGDKRRLGVRVENAWYAPSGQDAEQRQRVFLQAGDVSGKWTWSARVGTDGENVIGSASVFDDSSYRKEFFIERDLIETPLGLERNLYTTFAGAAIDIPADDRNIFTLLGGVQEFSGENMRYHVRANYVHVIKPEIGLSAQLRGRYFNSTEPNEFDYYSPEYFAQILPVLQMRRFIDGWALRAVGGIGVQRDSVTDWSQSNYAQLTAATTPGSGPWSFEIDLLYTNTPGNNAQAFDNYSYFQSRVALSRRF